jgi:pyruvate, water dikinase
MKLKVLDALRKKGNTPPTRVELMAAFKHKYYNFKQILESNSELLRIISDMEKKLRGEVGFGSSYVETQTLRAIFHAGQMIKGLENLSGREYPGLNRALGNIIQTLSDKQAPVPTRKISLYTLPYCDVTQEMVHAVGGKNAAIGEVRNRLGLPTPMGFAVTTAAYERFLHANRLGEAIAGLKQALDVVDTETVVPAGERIQQLFMEAEVPEELAQSILAEYDRLAGDGSQSKKRPFVSVRSSAILEDSSLSFAGQYLTVLNVPREGILHAYKRVLASLFTSKAIVYRQHMGVPLGEVAMSVACQEMVACQASGVMYTQNPLNPLQNRIIINAVWGLGAYAVDGVVVPDEYGIAKEPPLHVVERKVWPKSVRLVPKAEGDVIAENVQADLQQQPCLTERQAELLAEFGMRLENHFHGPQDVEWALDKDGRFLILQCRPLRLEMWAADKPQTLAPPLPGYAVLLEGGDVACPGVASGPAVVVQTDSDLSAFPEGGILISRQASAEFVMVMDRALAIVADSGSITGHLSALAKEHMVPTLLNVNRAVEVVRAGTEITVDASHARIYLGRVPELLQAEPVRPYRFSPEYLSLRRKADSIIPLNLSNPNSPHFAPQYCRTIHDIMRYVHEVSYAEIFQLGDFVTDHMRLSAHLVAPLPLDLYLIDLGGDLKSRQPGPRKSCPTRLPPFPSKRCCAVSCMRVCDRRNPDPSIYEDLWR